MSAQSGVSSKTAQLSSASLSHFAWDPSHEWHFLVPSRDLGESGWLPPSSLYYSCILGLAILVLDLLFLRFSYVLIQLA